MEYKNQKIDDEFWFDYEYYGTVFKKWNIPQLINMKN